MTNSIKAFLLASALIVAPLAAQAEIVDCPDNGRPYDTTHGYYVDVPGTDYYVEPSRRYSSGSTRSSGRSSRRSSSYSYYSY
jgi:hypothetical protein